MRILVACTLVVGLAVSVFATETPSLKQTVREDLIRRPYLHAGWVRVRAEGGTVTLLGRVPDELRRALVVRAVRNQPGVVLVKDDLVVDASLEAWTPTTVERTRERLENARRIVRGDPELGRYTTLHVARTRLGLSVTGEVSSAEERHRLKTLLAIAPGAIVEVRLEVRPDATRRSDARPPGDEATIAFAQSVTDAIAREPLLRGVADVRASVERGALVLRGSARDLPAHDLALEIARAELLVRQRAAERARVQSGELTRLLAGEPEDVPGELPGLVDSLVLVGDTSVPVSPPGR